MLKKVILIIGIILLVFSFTSAAEKKDVKAQPSLCKKVASMIKDGTINKYMPERVDIPDTARASEYLNLDIDNDGKADKVVNTSGEEGSYLEVYLSGGNKYVVDESGFIMLVKLNRDIYALVTYWEWDRRPDDSKAGKKIGNRLYKLTKHEAKSVCDIKDLKGGK